MEPEKPPDADSAVDRGLAFAFGKDASPSPTPSVLDQIGARAGARPAVSLREIDALGEAPPVTGTDQKLPDTGRYKILGLVARGGVGVIHRAHDTDLGRDVAMKSLDERYHDRPDVLYRFVEEAQIGGQLQHPGIVPVYELGLTDGRPFFTMKMVTGQTLAKKLAERASPATDRRTFLAIFEDICQTVAYAHARGVVHRDLKPANVMIGAFGEVQVVDWGMGKVLAQGGVADEREAGEQRSEHGEIATVRSSGHGTPSIAGSVMGTPAYMAPEQARGDIDAMDERSDVFGLGAILCEILTGRPPYVGEPDEVIGKATTADLDDAHARLAGCGAEPALVDLAQRCLLPSPMERPQSAKVVADEVHQHLAAAEAQIQNARVEAAEARVRAAALKRAQRVGIGFTAVIAASLVATLWFWRGAVVAADRERQAHSVASRREKEAAEARDQARTSLAHFDQLSHVVRLQSAKANEKTLYPSWPDRAQAMRDWLVGDARAVCDALPELRATVEVLEARALPWSEAEQVEARRSHPRAAELANLRAKLASSRRAQDVRAHSAEPPAVELPDSGLPTTAREMNELAWSLVRPDRERFGSEAMGLALARRARSLATDDATERAILTDTLAWALLANGLDDEAREQSRAALASASTVSAAMRAEYQGYLDEMEASIRAASGAEGRAEIERLQADITALDAEVGRRRDWRFTDRADQFLHDTLQTLISDIEAFAANQVADVEQRLAWAERVEELTITRFRERWDQARQAILAADGTTASALYATSPRIDLQPQLGLVPIGMNPVSKLWEFYHLRSAFDPTKTEAAESLPIPTYGPDGKLDMAGRGIVFVLIPGGTFTMGAQSADPRAPNYDALAERDEWPVRQVHIAPYFLSKYEMTQGQWARLSGGSYPSRFVIGRKYLGIPMPIGDKHPVEQVTYAMCTTLLGHHGLVIPTEAQWECGCRAGTTTPWFTGSTAASLEGFANVFDRSGQSDGGGFPTEAFDDGFKGPAPVGTFEPNAFGLFDVHGNVWEWCRDGYHPYELDGKGDDFLRPRLSINVVSRGGSCQTPASFARAAERSRCALTASDMYMGVRPAKPVLP